MDQYNSQQNRGRVSGLAWFALVVGVVALILAWVAFNRSGEDVEAVVDREVSEALLELEASFERMRAELRSEFENNNSAGGEVEGATFDASMGKN